MILALKHIIKGFALSTQNKTEQFCLLCLTYWETAHGLFFYLAHLRMQQLSIHYQFLHVHSLKAVLE